MPTPSTTATRAAELILRLDRPDVRDIAHVIDMVLETAVSWRTGHPPKADTYLIARLSTRTVSLATFDGKHFWRGDYSRRIKWPDVWAFLPPHRPYAGTGERRVKFCGLIVNRAEISPKEAKESGKG